MAAATKAPAAQSGGAPAAKIDPGLSTPKFMLKAGKTPKLVSAKVQGQVAEIIVDQAIDMADMCKIVLRNDDFSISDSDDFKPGSKIELELGYQEAGAKVSKVFRGEVTAVQAEFPRRSSMNVRVIAYTEYHRLMRGRHIRSWENRTISEIATQLASDCGLKPVVDATSERFEYLFQRNQTNLEFLLECADRVGYETFATDGKLIFRKATHGQTHVRRLKKGEKLLSFNPRVSAAPRPTGVKVISWDDEAVAQVVEEAKPTDSGPKMGGKEDCMAVSKKLGDAMQVVTQQVFRKGAGAKRLAVGMLQEQALELVRAEATVAGQHDLRPGFVVEIDGVGEIFSGPYYITRVVHDYLPSGFTTRLGLKKSSIIKLPTRVRTDLDENDEDLGDLADLFSGSDRPMDDTDSTGQDLANLKLAVGDEPPDWFFESEDLAGLDRLKILDKGYIPQPAPVLELQPEKNKIDAGQVVNVKVTAQRLDKIFLKMIPEGIALLSAKELGKDGGTIQVKGLADGKLSIEAEGIKGAPVIVSDAKIEIVGPPLKLNEYGYDGPVLIPSAEKTEVEAPKEIPVKVDFKHLDFVNIRVQPDDRATISQPSLKQPGQIQLKGLKDGLVTLRFDGVKNGHVRLQQNLEIVVIGQPLKLNDYGYKAPKLQVTLDKNLVDVGQKVTATVTVENLSNITVKLDPADAGDLSATTLGGSGNVTITAKKKSEARLTVSGTLDGRPYKDVSDIIFEGPELKLGGLEY